MAATRPARMRRVAAGVRARSVVAAVLVVAVALVVGGALLVYVLQRDLVASVESGALARAAEVAATVRAQGPAAARTDLLAQSGAGPLVQVVGPDGTVVAGSTPGATGRALTAAHPRDGQVSRREVSRLQLFDTDDPYLVVVEGASHAGVTWSVVAAAPLAAQRESVRTVGSLLLAGVPLLLALVGVATWLLVGRALQPVERIRGRVAAIGAGRLDERVPVPPSGDEIARLAATMNGMLDRLEAAQATQRRFVADASHELRSPLATLSASLDVATADPGGTAWDELREVLADETGRMRRLVEDLLLLARADDHGLALRRTDVDLDDLVLAEVRRARAAGGVQVTADVHPVRVEGDPGELAQVVRNLADNARRHARGEVRLAVATGNGEAVLTIDDDGSGVPAGERERVFERFVRLDDSRGRASGGTGLGLAIVREIVRGHEGTVALEPSPLGGARAVVRLPLPVGAAPAREGARA